MPLNAQGQLKCVDQKIYLQMTHKTEQRPEGQIATFGFLPRQRAELGEQVTESFWAPDGFLNGTVIESQPMKSVPCRVRLAIERNIVAISPNSTHQPRAQRKHLHFKSVEATRPLRGIALFDGMCDLTDAETQEATFRTCCSANPGILIMCISRTASRSHLGFCTALRAWQHERGAPHIMILTDSEGTLSEEAHETLHGSEESAWLGRDLRQMWTRARLDSTISAMSHARVWTSSSQLQHTFSKKRSQKKDRSKAMRFATCWKQWHSKKPPAARGSLLRDCATLPMRSSWHRWKHS